LKNRGDFLKGFNFNEGYSSIEKQVDGVSCLEIIINGEAKVYKIMYKNEDVTKKLFSKQIKETCIQFVVIPFESSSNIKSMFDVLIFGTVVKPEDAAKPYSLILYEDKDVRKYVFDQFTESTGLKIEELSFSLSPAMINTEDAPYYINDNCNGCGACKAICPTQAIVECSGKYVIDGDMCIDCGACEGECSINAIIARG
jgi:ferredoxin